MLQKIEIETPPGRLAALLQRPDSRTCPLVILMHGFMANKELEPLKTLAAKLEAAGIASLRFDFNGHGRSYGRFCDMNVLRELDDARAVYAFARKLPWVTGISLAGHSQGGVVAGMLAGELGAEQIDCLVQLAPAAVLQDDARNGVLMGKHYDPANPPEHLWVFFHKVGRSYFTVAQTLPIYETSARYTGPVCLIHGKKDKIVPYTYSERYDASYADSSLLLLENEGHLMRSQRGLITDTVVQFIKKRYGLSSD